MTAGPRLLTPQVRRVILGAIRQGMHPPEAAELAGISRNLWRQWVFKSRRGHISGEPYKPTDLPYIRFMMEVETAKAEWTQSLLVRIDAYAAEGGKDGLRALDILLKATRSADYGPRSADAELTQRVTVAILDRLRESLPPEAFGQALRALQGGATVEVEAEPHALPGGDDGDPDPEG